MKATYWFKPNTHWNVVSFEVYEFLCKFYAKDNRLKVTYEESK